MDRRLLALVLVPACSSSRPEPSPGSQTQSGSAPALIAVPGDAPAADAIVPGPLAGYPAPVVPTPGCELIGPWKAQPEELRFVDGGKPYASLYDVKRAEVTLGDGAPGVFADLDTGAVRLVGFVDRKDFALHASHPFTVAGWVAPGPSAALRYLANTGGQIAFEVGLPAAVHAKTPPRGERLCEDFAIDDAQDFDPRDAITVPTASDGYLPAKVAIPLALEPGKPPIATLRYDDSPQVDVLEQRGKHTRVVVLNHSLNPLDHVSVYGWITTRLDHGAHGYGGSWATGGGHGAVRPRPRRDTRFVTCATVTPLIAELDTERRLVGTVAPNTIIEILPGGDEIVEVRLHRASVVLAEGARWLATQAALAGCQVATRP